MRTIRKTPLEGPMVPYHPWLITPGARPDGMPPWWRRHHGGMPNEYKSLIVSIW